MRHWTNNIFALVDSYKDSHHLFYAPDLNKIAAYLEPRGGHSPYVSTGLLQYYLTSYLTGPDRLTLEMIDEQSEDAAEHFGTDKIFNRQGFLEILDKFGGYLPFSLWALPEGTVVSPGTPVLVVESEGDFPWFATYIETLLSQVWYPNTVSTNSLGFKLVEAEYLIRTQGSLDGLEFMTHDFGERGVSCPEQAGIGGAAHLMHFLGTDNRAALRLLKTFYDDHMAGYSVAATEHSVMGSWGGPQGELTACQNALERCPTGVLSVVSDTYNIHRALKEIWGTELAEKVRTRPGKLVIRLDSGDPREMVLNALKVLKDQFGAERNALGYKKLPPYLGLLQGDGVDRDVVREILHEMAEAGWCASNIVFGSGGALLQKVNRDTHKHAYKANAGYNRETGWRDIYKDPITDQGKRSKRGRQAVVVDANGHLVAVPLEQVGSRANWLEPVVTCGRLVRKVTFSQVRSVADAHFKVVMR